MTMMEKKELQFEKMSSIVGGNAVGPVKETGPLQGGKAAWFIISTNISRPA